jgi:hypothetical protein
MSAAEDLRHLDYPSDAYEDGTAPVVNGHGVMRWARALGGYTGPLVYLWYRPAERGRATIHPAWQVVEVGAYSDPNGHFTDHGHKTFLAGGGGSPTKVPALEQAQDWAAERYGITEWTNMPGLTNMRLPLEVVTKAKATIKAAKRKTKTKGATS